MNALAEKIRESAEVVSLGLDMSILNEGRGDAPKMPGELFGDMWSIIEGVAQAKGSPVDYAALAYLAAAASAIGGKRKARPFEGDWVESTVIWAACVGAPSCNKSPAMDSMVDPIEVIEREFAEAFAAETEAHSVSADIARAEYDAWQKAVRHAVDNGKGPPEKPSGAVIPEEPLAKRNVVKDATVEALADVLKGNHAGVLCYRDELTGWLESFDRYSTGGKPFWLEAFRGKPNRIDRKGGGSTYIPYSGVCVLGSIQPDKFRDIVLSAADDGLAARFIYAWPTSVEFTRPRPVPNAYRIGDVYRALSGLPWGFGADGEEVARVLPFAPSGADLFEEWCKRNQRDAREAHGLYQGFVGKGQGLVPRLALIGELTSWALRGGQEPDNIALGTVAAAIEFVEDYAKPSAMRVFGASALPDDERNAAILAKYILKNRMWRINLRALKNSPHKAHLPTMRKADAMNAAVEVLVDANWLVLDGERSGGTPGRQSADYTVNPLALGD